MPTDPVYTPSLPYSGRSSIHGSPESGSSMARSSCRSSSSWGLAAGLCAGAVAGAAIALLSTPKRGSEVRSSLRSYASQGGERLQELVSTGRCLAEDAIHQATALIEEGRRAFTTSSAPSASGSNGSTGSWSSSSSSQPLTASVAEISGRDRRFEEPLGG